MFGRKQLTTLFILIIGLLGLTLLATGLVATEWIPSAESALPRINIQPLENTPFDVAPEDRISPTRAVEIFRIVMLVSMGICLIAAIRFPRLGLSVAACIGAILFYNYFIVPRYLTELTPPTNISALDLGAEDVPQADPVIADEPTFVEPPSWLATVVAVVPAAIFASIILFVVYRYLNKPAPRTSLAAEIAEEAEVARDEIEMGYDLRDAILRAYAQMTESVRRHRGIVRQDAVTPSEFIDELHHAGLPAKPIQRLTVLFEQMRYGTEPAGVRDQREAISCLEEIVIAAERLEAAS